MIQTIIHRLLLRRHFWRYATFSEVAELYASRMMRIFALRLVSVFTSIYLLQLGFSVLFIALFWAVFYLLKVLFSIPSAHQIAAFGPKHATFISNIISALAMFFLPFASDPHHHIMALIAWCTLQGYSGSLNDMAYLVDFSKVKSAKHAGKEIGYMNIIEKVATGLSPFIGGTLAFLFGPQAVMVVSAVLFLLSAAPLFATAEPTKIHGKLNFKGYPWRTTWRSSIAEAAVGVDVYLTSIVWAIFLALVVFGISSNKIYAQIGIITSVTLIVALLVSYSFGRIIDHRKGGDLLRMGAILNSLIHFGRVFVTTPFTAVIMNVLNEVSTAGYNMPFLRGMFDTADYSGKRIEYLLIAEIMLNFGGMIMALIMALLVTLLGNLSGMNATFIVGGILTLLIAVPGFALYKK